MLTGADIVGSGDGDGKGWGYANQIAFANSSSEPGYKDQFCTCVLVKLFNSGESLAV